ncbi:MAG: hypothetical protein JWO98_5300 [Frankiales bacterium]|nr:hypothetical protein [Frankiales bacterium]
MSKDKSKKKHAKTEAPALSKKERKALEEREATLAAELAEREKKAAKKAKKKGKKHDAEPDVKPLSKADRDALAPKATAAEAVESLRDMEAAETVIAAADAVINGKSSKGAVESAKKAKAKAEAVITPPTDAELKATVAARKQLRIDAPAALAEVDRADAEAVKTYNDTYGKATGSYITSDDEKAASDHRVKGMVQMQTTPPQTTDEAFVADMDAALVAVETAVTEVETDHGREFVAGTAPAIVGDPEKAETIAERGFAVPSDAKPTDYEKNGLGQYIVKSPVDGKLKGYTRVTTFIDCLEDKTALQKWAKRILLEGILFDQTPDEATGEIADRLSTVRDLVHNRDVAIAKARKADRKGKIGTGELAGLITSAEKAFKDGVDPIIVELEEVGGIHVKANKGTELHALCELADVEGIDAVGDLLTAGKITPADLADVEAYLRAMQVAGLKVLENEVMVVNDEKKRAGRLDKIVMARMPGAARASRMVADIKTGRIDMGVKIPLQLDNYADMQAYDPTEPDVRRDLKLSRTKALLIHLPAGTATCSIYVVDLGTGRIGNKLAEEVRAFRNTGKKGIDTTVDLADPKTWADAS